jgi:hypothetical protein
MAQTDAVYMARKVGVSPKKFRSALRKENFSWHVHGSRWTVDIGTTEHRDMEEVLRKISN